MKKLIILTLSVITMSINGQTSSICDQIDSLYSKIDSLITENNSLKAALSDIANPSTHDTVFYNQDTISIKLLGEKEVTILKTGEQINYYLVDGLFRVDLFYNDKHVNEFFNYDKKSYWGVSTILAIPVK